MTLDAALQIAFLDWFANQCYCTISIPFGWVRDGIERFPDFPRHCPGRHSRRGSAEIVPADHGAASAALERAVGQTLFQRTGKGLVLTDEGAAVLANAERIEEEALAFERQLGARPG